MNWNVLNSYLIFAECSAIVALGFVLFAENPPEFVLIGKQKKPKTWTEVCLTVLKYLTLAPIIAPYLAFKQSRAMHQAEAEMAHWENVKRTHYELLLDPLSRSDFSDELWDYLEVQSSPLIARNYLCLGDFRTKAEPLPGQVRYFLSPGGTALVELGEVVGTRFCESGTFLEDGTVVISASVDPFDSIDELAECQYFVQCLPKLDFVDLLAQHDAFVAATRRRNSVGIRTLSMETWQDYARYSNLRFSQIKYEAGRADTPPPAHEFPRWAPPVTDDGTTVSV
jgi:hypothetical protein